MTAPHQSWTASTRTGTVLKTSESVAGKIRRARSAQAAVKHVSLVAFPNALNSTLSSIYEVINALELTSPFGPAPPPLHVDIVGETTGLLDLASGVPLEVQRSIDEIATTDVVIVPSALLPTGGWQRGRHPRLVAWLYAMHQSGAAMCAAGSGLFLLAETGLFEGQDATLPLTCASEFAQSYPSVPLRPERILLVAGSHGRLIISAASTNGHDLALYLIARYAGSAAAHAIARRFALQLRYDALAPLTAFEGRADHGDAEIVAAQRWLIDHFSVASPVEELIRRSSLPSSTFKRRFTDATGLCPIAYVQRLRVEDAKRRLERSKASIDTISWQVGYEDAAFFRRLFKRITGLTPGSYRKRYRVPDFA